MDHYMKLFDDTMIQIEPGASLGHIVHIAEDEAAAVAVCRKITPANLEHVDFYQGEEVIGSYENLQIKAAPTRSDSEDGVIVTISLREQTDIEARVAALEAGQAALTESQDIQDGAIEDLGAAVSGLAEVL